MTDTNHPGPTSALAEGDAQAAVDLTDSLTHNPAPDLSAQLDDEVEFTDATESTEYGTDLDRAPSRETEEQRAARFEVEALKIPIHRLTV